MIYFTYKLKFVPNDGYHQPESLSPFEGGRLKADGETLIGFSKQTLVETFSPKTISDHQIFELSEADFLTGLKECGLNSPAIVEDKIVELTPSYLEPRGEAYVEKLEAEVVKTKPEIIEPK